MYMVKTAPDESRKGIFATQDIDPGTLIFSDRMLLCLRVKSEGSQVYSEEDKAQLLRDALEHENQKFQRIKGHCENAFGRNKALHLTKKNLKNGRPETQELLIKAVLDQGIRIDGSWAQGQASSYQLFDDFHSLQHSCNPNAHAQEHEGRWRIDVRAIKGIKKGEEIFHSHENPFRQKQERRYSPGAQGCRCEVCANTEKDGVPLEQLYCELEKKFAVIKKFRGRFFRPEESTDLSNAHVDRVLFDKAKAVNSISKAEREEVREACQWIDERKDEHGLMHICFAEGHEVIHLINFAYVVEHGNRSPWSNEMADEEPSSDDGEEDDGKSNDEEASATAYAQMESEHTTETSLDSNGQVLQPGHHDIGEEQNSDDKQQVSGSESSISSPATEPLSPVDSAIIAAYTAKVQEMKIRVICNGFEHFRSRGVIEQAWMLSGWNED